MRVAAAPALPPSSHRPGHGTHGRHRCLHQRFCTTVEHQELPNRNGNHTSITIAKRWLGLSPVEKVACGQPGWPARCRRSLLADPAMPPDKQAD